MEFSVTNYFFVEFVFHFHLSVHVGVSFPFLVGEVGTSSWLPSAGDNLQVAEGG